MDRDIRPGRWMYGVAVFVLMAGIAAFVLVLVTGIIGMTYSNKQVVVPGSSEIMLDKPGEYIIFHEYVSVAGDKIYRSNSGLEGLKCTVTNKSTGQAVELSTPWSSSRYEIGNRQAISVFQFTIEEPGEYVLSAQYDGNAEGPQTVLAISQGFGGKLTGTILGSIGILLVSIAGFIIIMVVTSKKRRESRLELQRRY